MIASQKVVLPEAVQQIFRDQMINGDSLTVMTKEDLKADGIPSGVAAQIMKRIPQ